MRLKRSTRLVVLVNGWDNTETCIFLCKRRFSHRRQGSVKQSSMIQSKVPICSTFTMEMSLIFRSVEFYCHILRKNMLHLYNSEVRDIFQSCDKILRLLPSFHCAPSQESTDFLTLMKDISNLQYELVGKPILGRTGG